MPTRTFAAAHEAEAARMADWLCAKESVLTLVIGCEVEDSSVAEPSASTRVAQAVEKDAPESNGDVV